MSRLIESHSAEYPTPTDVFRAALAETLERGAGSRCHFDGADSSVWVEVTPGERGLLIRLPCPRREGPEEILAEKGVGVPDHWRIVEFRKHGRRSPGFMITYLAPEKDLDRIIAFLDRLFASTSAKNPSYRVSGSVQS